MALTDTAIKKAKAKEKAYSLNGSRGLYPNGNRASRKS
jgi:hypothetical protein